MCMAPTNPQVIAATSAALGVFTPQPCIPVTSSPWTPGSLKVTVKGLQALDTTCMCNCQWLGIITITTPGQVAVQA
jgi:hypothetical protein